MTQSPGHHAKIFFISLFYFNSCVFRPFFHARVPLDPCSQRVRITALDDFSELARRTEKFFPFCCPSLEQMGQGGHFIPRFTGPLASSGVANPSPSSHSSFWALAHSPSLPPCPPSKQTHPPLPLPLPLPLPRSVSLIRSPLPNLATREVCGTEASIIDRASV